MALREAESSIERVHRLVIIAGISCSGKSTLIRKIKHGQCQQVSRQLDIGHPRQWEIAHANLSSLCETGGPVIHRMILHHDITFRKLDDKTSCLLRDLILKSEEVSVLTLCASRKQLLKRVPFRVIYTLFRLAMRKISLARAARLARMYCNKTRTYTNHQKVYAVYENWHKFVSDNRVSNHFLLDCTKPEINNVSPFDMDLVKSILS